MYSFCDNFSKRMQDEVDDILIDSKRVTQKDILKDKDVKIKLSHKILAYLLKKYL
jgi:hypothetical protein